MFIIESVGPAAFHSSVVAKAGDPPKAKAAVKDPEPANPVFADGKSATSAHELPSQYSVFANAPGSLFPPNNKTSVLTGPALPFPVLAVFISVVSVQDDPFHNST